MFIFFNANSNNPSAMGADLITWPFDSGGNDEKVARRSSHHVQELA
jgi:hypothetical protein